MEGGHAAMQVYYKGISIAILPFLAVQRFLTRDSTTVPIPAWSLRDCIPLCCHLHRLWAHHLN